MLQCNLKQVDGKQEPEADNGDKNIIYNGEGEECSKEHGKGTHIFFNPLKYNLLYLQSLGIGQSKPSSELGTFQMLLIEKSFS